MSEPLDPAEDELNRLMAISLQFLEANDLAGATESFEQATQLKPDDPKYMATFGEALLDQEYYPEAELYLRKAVELSPEDATSLRLLGLSLYRQTRYQEAEETLETALKIDPTDEAAHYWKGCALSQQERHAEAEFHLREAVRLAPDDWHNRVELGLILYDQEKYLAAENTLRVANRLEYSGEGAYWLGKALWWQEKYDEALGCYWTALEQAWVEDKTDYWFGSVLEALDNEAESEDDPELWLRLARALSRIGRKYEALRAAGIAVHLDAINPEIYFELGSLYLEIDNLGNARRLLGETLDRNPRHLGATKALGVALLRQGFLDDARELFWRGLELDPHDAEIRKYLDI